MFWKKKSTLDEKEILSAKTYFDRIAPSVLKFWTDHYICGNFYKSVWAVSEYPPTTEETAILAHLGDKSGITLRIYNRLVDTMEQRKIVQQAMRKNHMMTTVTDVNENIKAQDNINDVLELLSELRRNKEPLLHTAVFIELKASTEEKLHELQSDVQMELTRSRITIDKLLTRQQEGFLSVLPSGHNMFGTEFERIFDLRRSLVTYKVNVVSESPEQPVSIAESDNLYLFVSVTHKSTAPTYYLQKLSLSNETAREFLIQDPHGDNWQNSNGGKDGTSRYNGSSTEQVTVRLVKAESENFNMNNAISGTNCATLDEGSTVGNLVVHYSSPDKPETAPKENPDDDETVYYNTVQLTPLTAGSGYNFKTILGDSLYFGITADRFNKRMHAETNFAVNYYQQMQDANGELVDSPAI